MLKRLSFLNWIASVLCWESIGHVSVGLFPDFLFHSVSLLSAAHSFVCCTTFHWANTLRVFTHMLLLTGTWAASTLLPLWIAAVDVLARTPCCTRMRVPLVFTPRVSVQDSGDERVRLWERSCAAVMWLETSIPSGRSLWVPSLPSTGCPQALKSCPAGGSRVEPLCALICVPWSRAVVSLTPRQLAMWVSSFRDTCLHLFAHFPFSNFEKSGRDSTKNSVLKASIAPISPEHFRVCFL